MFQPLVLILVALVVFVLGVSWQGIRSQRWPEKTQHYKTFLYVGTAACGLLALAVLVVGLISDRAGSAARLAMFGLFSYVIFLFVTAAVMIRIDRSGGALALQVPTDGQTGGHGTGSGSSYAGAKQSEADGSSSGPIVAHLPAE